MKNLTRGFILVATLLVISAAVPSYEDGIRAYAQSNAGDIRTAPAADGASLQTAESYAASKQLERESELFYDNVAMLRNVAIFLGVFFTVLGALAAAFGIKTFRDVKKVAAEQATEAIEDAISSSSKEHTSLQQLLSDIENASARLNDLQKELEGYTLLAQTADSASSFDPLVEYYGMRAEIKKRKRKLTAHLSGDETIDTSQTTYDPQFRQRAAVMFERLLEAVKSDHEAKRIRLSSNDLYNASANASDCGLDFVAIEMMELAETLANGTAPAITSRVIRQRLSRERINADQAKEQFKDVIARVGGYDLHLVLSEASNIAFHASDPVSMATLIEENLQDHLKETSYVRLKLARLLYSGDQAEHWQRADTELQAGIEALKTENRQVRWFESALQEISIILGRDPFKWEIVHGAGLEFLGKFKTPSEFSRYNGQSLALVLSQMGVLGEFIVEPKPSS